LGNVSDIFALIFVGLVVALVMMAMTVALLPVFVAAYGPECRNGDFPTISLRKFPIVCVAGYNPTDVPR
jgi:hypothetical protein